MIRNLYQEAIRDFGLVQPDKHTHKLWPKQHSIRLEPGVTQVYRSRSETWLSAEAGMTVLSVSEQDGDYLDFYLDKPVLLRPGLWFALAALDQPTCVQVAGELPPEPVQERQTPDWFFIRPKLQVASLCTLFYQERERGFLFPGEAHPMVELTYVDQGSLHSVVDGQDIVLEQGDMMLYGPGQWHMQYADIGVAPRFVTISFTMQGLEDDTLYNRKFRSPRRAVLCLQQILREQEQNEPDCHDAILALLTQLIISLRREGTQSSKPQLSNSVNNENEIIRCAQQYISSHVYEKLSVPLVAKGADVSPSYLTALFHKHLQLSPGEYIRRIKLQQSKRMIREGNLNFTEIAASLQYSTVHHFSRQFKEKFGLTPTEYARSVR